jgi:hypothetical protein
MAPHDKLTNLTPPHFPFLSHLPLMFSLHFLRVCLSFLPLCVGPCAFLTSRSELTSLQGPRVHTHKKPCRSALQVTALTAGLGIAVPDRGMPT